jgi:hypothetical protein
VGSQYGAKYEELIYEKWYKLHQDVKHNKQSCPLY